MPAFWEYPQGKCGSSRLKAGKVQDAQGEFHDHIANLQLQETLYMQIMTCPSFDSFESLILFLFPSSFGRRHLQPKQVPVSRSRQAPHALPLLFSVYDLSPRSLPSSSIETPDIPTSFHFSLRICLEDPAPPTPGRKKRPSRPRMIRRTSRRSFWPEAKQAISA